ncbi:hypothetical protein BGW80DRAFT_1317287 [Lactifluus volemus]|nr:hypothetical protein BGW80DRAFT_1317287 [Lactifluus volemus]
MAEVQSRKKTVVESDQDQAVLLSRDPRTVCMTKKELDYLLASFQVNRWPRRDEKERLARLIGKTYEKVHHWFSNQRQKTAHVERARPSSESLSPEAPSTRTNPSIKRASILPSTIKSETSPSPPPNTLIREDMSDTSDTSIEDAHLLLYFAASASGSDLSSRKCLIPYQPYYP